MSQRGRKGNGKERREKLLKFIHEFKTANDYSPDNREMGQAVGISSTSVTVYHIKALKKQGFVDYVPKLARTIRLTEAGKQHVQQTPQR